MIVANSTSFGTNNSSCFSAIPVATFHCIAVNADEGCFICTRAALFTTFHGGIFPTFRSSTENNCSTYAVTLASNLSFSPDLLKYDGQSIRCIKD